MTPGGLLDIGFKIRVPKEGNQHERSNNLYEILVCIGDEISPHLQFLFFGGGLIFLLLKHFCFLFFSLFYLFSLWARSFGLNFSLFFFACNFDIDPPVTHSHSLVR